MFGIVPVPSDLSQPDEWLPGVPQLDGLEKQGVSQLAAAARLEIATTASRLTVEVAEQWLLSAGFAEVRRALTTVRAQRPDLFEGLAEEDDPKAGESAPGADIVVDGADAVRKSDAESMAKELPLVQFTAPFYFCHESEDAMIVEVARLGNHDGCAEVHYTTNDVTAFAGLRYKATAGKLVFQPGETQKEIHIPLYFTKDWEATTEFLVRLVQDPPPTGCALGRYLYKARVKVIDGGIFPTPRFRQEVEEGNISTVPKWPLLYGYVCLNFRIPVVRKGSIKMVMIDALHNVYFLLQLLINVYLVDNVIKGDLDEEPLVQLLVIAGLLVVPFGILHVLDYLRLSYGTGGASRTMLQKALLRKFLNYNECSRQQLNRGDIVMAMTRDVVCLVHDGYFNAIALIKSVSQIFAVLLFQILAPLLFEKKFNSFPFVMFCVFPIFLIGFLLMRREVTTRQFAEKNRKQDSLVAQIDRTVTNYPLISDYNRRPFFVARYEAMIKAYNGAETSANKVLTNNTYFAPWLTVIAVASYIVMGGLQAYHGDIGVGMFLANIAIIRAIGSSMGSIYSILLEMQGTFPALENITTLMNLPTDLPQRMAINRYRRGATTTICRSLTVEFTDAGLAFDRMTITVTDVRFDFNPASAIKGACPSLNLSGRMEVHQGQLVSLVGPKGGGKSTLLKILGGVILPEPGAMFVPSHLRVLHISPEPLFFKGSLFENLTFGVLCDEDEKPARVEKLCEKLGLQGPVLALVQEGKDGEPQAWSEVLSFTQRCLLCLVRAFIANPELMCIHKPTMPFDEQASIIIFDMLREFCKNKGVELSEKTRHMRRPRTCIMTSSKVLGVKMSDAVYVLSQKDGIKRVDKDNVQDHMLH